MAKIEKQIKTAKKSTIKKASVKKSAAKKSVAKKECNKKCVKPIKVTVASTEQKKEVKKSFWTKLKEFFGF